MNFSFYMVDSAYCNYLRKTDPCVPYTTDKRSIRPFVGIVFNNGEWGAINFNNMIPVSFENLTKVEMRILDSDSKSDIDYKNLLSNQLSWCNSHRNIILKQAEKLYDTIVQGKAWGNLSNRCCNFLLDEKQCLEYKQELLEE